jgi:hypothetical protein
MQRGGGGGKAFQVAAQQYSQQECGDSSLRSEWQATQGQGSFAALRTTPACAGRRWVFNGAKRGCPVRTFSFGGGSCDSLA